MVHVLSVEDLRVMSESWSAKLSCDLNSPSDHGKQEKGAENSAWRFALLFLYLLIIF